MNPYEMSWLHTAMTPTRACKCLIPDLVDCGMITDVPPCHQSVMAPGAIMASGSPCPYRTNHVCSRDILAALSCHHAAVGDMKWAMIRVTLTGHSPIDIASFPGGRDSSMVQW